MSQAQAAAAYVDEVDATPMVDRQPVHCACGHAIFDGIVVRSRVVRVLPRGGAEAKCKCKRWVPVPLTYDGG